MAWIIARPGTLGPDGGSEVNDILGTVSYLQGRKDVDARKVGVWGGSYGGLMTALALARRIQGHRGRRGLRGCIQLEYHARIDWRAGGARGCNSTRF